MSIWKKRIEVLNSFNKSDDAIKKALKEMFEVLFPGSYSPILETPQAGAYIIGLAGEDKELLQDLEYLVFEAKNMESAMVEHNGKTYNFKNNEDLIKYFEKFYPII